MLRFFLFVVVLLAVVSLPFIAAAERRPTMLEVDHEVFQHFDYPCHAFRMIKLVKEWESTPKGIHKFDRRAMSAALLVIGKKKLIDEADDRWTAIRINEILGIDLRTFSPMERMEVYHSLLSGCIATTYDWDTEVVMEADFLNILSSVGWIE